MKGIAGIFIVFLVIVGAVVIYDAAYTVPETKQAIITQFGKPVGEPVTKAGLHFKTPFIQKVNMIEKRILEWDGQATEMPTKNKTYISVDTFGRWRISDAKQYFLRLNNERRALSRLDGILGSETMSAIAKHELTEVIRTTVDREPNAEVAPVEGSGSLGVLNPITLGRAKIEQEIFENAATKLTDIGIELLDVRFKRINYNNNVQQKIYDRMISERQQIAERFRSEGAGEAAKITGKRERDLQEIESEAYKKVQAIQGEADARATEIYANAFNQSQKSVEFYEFIKSLETYETILQDDTTLILSTDSDVFKYLKDIEPNRN